MINSKYLSLFFLAIFASLLASCKATHNTPYQQAQTSYANHDYARAFQELALGVKLKDPKSMYAMGYMYYYGIGAKKDQDVGRVLIEHAAKAEYPAAVQALRLIHQRKHHQKVPFQKASGKQPQLAFKSKPLHIRRYTA